MPSLFKACLFVFTLAMGSAYAEDKELLALEVEDAEQARKAARTTLPDFLDRYRSPQRGDEHFSLKIELEDDNGREFIWVTGFTINGNIFEGRVSNTPQVIKVVQPGQLVEFTHDIIVDWSFMHFGVMQGNFSLRAYLKTLPEHQAQSIRQQVGW